MKKQKKLILIFAAVFAVLLIAYFAVIRPLTKDGGSKPLEPVPLLDGEAYFSLNGSPSTRIPILYSQFDREDVYEVRVKNDRENYLFYHYISDASSGAKNYFALGQNEGGTDRFYVPPVAGALSDFDYTTLYDDTSKIPGMIVTTGSVFFKERIFVRADAETPLTDEEYQAVLHKYGLATEDHPASFEITGYARDKNGNYLYQEAGTEKLVCARNNADGTKDYFYAEGVTYSEETGYGYDGATAYTASLTGIAPFADATTTRRVFVGSLAPDDTCYYIYLEGRDIVYMTGDSSVGEIVGKSLSYYVYPRLATKTDSEYTPYMPEHFRIWNKTASGDGTGVAYTCDGKSGFFPLVTGEVDPRIVAGLAGKGVGDVLSLTELHERVMEETVGAAVTVAYDFYNIEAIVGADNLNRETGAVVSASDIVLVLLRRDGGELVSGAIDLGSADTPAAIRTALTGKTVGSGDTLGILPIASCSVTYDDSVTHRYTCPYQITAIGGFASDAMLSDLNTTAGAVVPRTGYVLIQYVMTVDGVRYTETATLNLAGEESSWLSLLAAKTVGEKVGPQTALTLDIDFPYDPVQSYVLYENLRIVSCPTYREELSFSFIQASQRDIFYAFNAYEITGPLNRTMYTLDYTNCQTALLPFADLAGTETVRVGLTAEAIAEYGLDAHIFSFSLPFGLYEMNPELKLSNPDYGHTYALDFCLYISDEAEDGTRYVGSTMYDTVVKTDADAFDFVDWDFTTKWVREKMLLIDVGDVSELSFDLNFNDLKESHSFFVTSNQKYYIDASSSETTTREYVWYVAGDTVRYRYETVAASEVNTDNRTYQTGQYYTRAGMLISPTTGGQYLVTSATNGVNLDQHYEDLNGETSIKYMIDFDGVRNFKELITILYTTNYSGASKADLSDAEVATLIGDSANRQLNIRIKLVDGRKFELGFYRYSDGRVLVRFLDVERNVSSTEFFLYAGEVKNIVSALRTLVSGGEVDGSLSYQPE